MDAAEPQMGHEMGEFKAMISSMMPPPASMAVHHDPGRARADAIVAAASHRTL